jgi:hypothetical protein
MKVSWGDIYRPKIHPKMAILVDLISFKKSPSTFKSGPIVVKSPKPGHPGYTHPVISVRVAIYLLGFHL